MLPRNRLPTTVVAGVRPSPLRLSATQAAKPAPKVRDYQVSIDFSADGSWDTFGCTVEAQNPEEAEALALAALRREYGDDFDDISFKTRRA